MIRPYQLVPPMLAWIERPVNEQTSRFFIASAFRENCRATQLRVNIPLFFYFVNSALGLA
jgi:hypothetical protein